MQDHQAEAPQIVIVGAGIAGLSTALGLHHLGIRSLVLESSPELRTSGFAFTTWTNAWRALDSLGIGEQLRGQHTQLVRASVDSIEGVEVGKLILDADGHEVRCVQRKVLLEALERELPRGTIRFGSTVVSLLDEDNLSKPGQQLKLIHLANGDVIKAKVVVGCDGVNSAVAKWLGFNKAVSAGRAAVRGFAYYRDGHGLDPVLTQCLGKGVRSGYLPCDDHSIYWFFTFDATPDREKELESDPVKLKQFVLERLDGVPDRFRAVVENTEEGQMMLSPLKFRLPWEVVLGSISKGNVCIAGDACHPMTPDIGQGGCAALEDGVVLARCLGQALFLGNHDNSGNEEEEEYRKIERCLRDYANQRRWRASRLIATAFAMGNIMRSQNRVVRFLRTKFLGAVLNGQFLKHASFDCGSLTSP
ncbi:hypothetical protein MLD38_040357 [Melastoma candidum]|uniref:Uncharacterized protein n=1 Tax=Melastoma candidum TaxID=119954 RepID=A0ACB9L5S2_9MYRT|nr:hypothetical protein MLD38_040357 [Melastoma candidum]